MNLGKTKMSFHSRSLSELSRNHKKENTALLDLSSRRLQKFDLTLLVQGIPIDIRNFGLTNIQELNLRGNFLKTTEGILEDRRNHFPNLRVLNLSENRLSEVFSLPTSLRELSIAHNFIESLQTFFLNRKEPQLKLLLNLEKLDISNNRLKALTRADFEMNKNLREINCSHNEIKLLKGFTRLDKLFKLDISFNKIDSLADFKAFNGRNQELKQLMIKNNPVTVNFPPNFKNEGSKGKNTNAVNLVLQKYLPCLEILDGIEIPKMKSRPKFLGGKENALPNFKVSQQTERPRTTMKKTQYFNSGSLTERGSAKSKLDTSLLSDHRFNSSQTRDDREYFYTYYEQIPKQSVNKLKEISINKLQDNRCIQEEIYSSIDSKASGELFLKPNQSVRRASSSNLKGLSRAGMAGGSTPTKHTKSYLENSMKRIFSDLRVDSTPTKGPFSNIGISLSQSSIKIMGLIDKSGKK